MQNLVSFTIDEIKDVTKKLRDVFLDPEKNTVPNIDYVHDYLTSKVNDKIELSKLPTMKEMKTGWPFQSDSVKSQDTETLKS
jgi:hypothetical protein